LRNINKVILSTILVALASCSIFVPDRTKDKKSENLSTNFDQSGWKKIPPEKSDFAFHNEKQGAIIIANSFCKKHLSTSLDKLAYTFLGEIKELEIIENNESQYKGRESRDILAKGKMDGVLVHLKLKTLIKDHCLYDFVLISPKSITNIQKSDFNLFLDSVEFQD